MHPEKIKAHSQRWSLQSDRCVEVDKDLEDMPYCLRNALPTFVRAMNYTFEKLTRNMVEVYVDDIVVKTKEGSTLIDDLTLVFDRLRATRTKLNPDKCVFGVSAGKLLGFLVSHRGIEANPTKIRAIEAMRPPTRIKDV